MVIMNGRRPSMLPALAMMALALSASPALAANEGKGSFHFGKVRFQPVDALAYQVDGKEAGKPLTIIVLSDFKIDRPAVMEAIDTGGALLAQVLGREAGNFVMVRLSAPNRCGLAAFLGKGEQQIDLGDSFSAKGTTSAARVAGECSTSEPGKMFDDAYDFKLPYDVPLTAIPKPTPLPAGGGEPGHALVALIKAIQAADWNSAAIVAVKTATVSLPRARKGA
jgi:hypothetical protein